MSLSIPSFIGSEASARSYRCGPGASISVTTAASAVAAFAIISSILAIISACITPYMISDVGG